MSEKVKPKCPLCGVEMDQTADECDPGTTVWECIGRKNSCNIEVMITEMWEQIAELEEADE